MRLLALALAVIAFVLSMAGLAMSRETPDPAPRGPAPVQRTDVRLHVQVDSAHRVACYYWSDQYGRHDDRTISCIPLDEAYHAR